MNITHGLPEPTDTEIKQTKKLIKDRYDIVLPESELTRLVTLINELEWWRKAEETPAAARQFTEEQLSDLRELLEQSGSQNLSQADIRNHAHTLLAIVPMKEKQRLADEIRGILVEHRPVPYEPVVVKKTVELLKAHYGVMLTDDQLEQLIPLLVRTLWYNEGLDSSLEECIDNLIRHKSSKKHEAVSKTLDAAVSKLRNEA